MKIGNSLKLYFLFLSLIFPSLNVYSYEFEREIGGIQYKLNTYDHTAIVYGWCKNAPLKLIIPSEVEWKNEIFKVTQIYGLRSLPSNEEPILPYSLTIPPTVTYLSTILGRNIDKLKEINLPDAPIWLTIHSFKNDPSLEYIYIPPKVAYIEEEVFSECENLRTVVVGSGNTHISSKAFYNDLGIRDKVTELKLIRLLSETPPEYFDAFKHYIDTAILMVPPGTKSSYQNSDWRYFDRIVEFDAELFNRYVPDFAKIPTGKPSASTTSQPSVTSSPLSGASSASPSSKPSPRIGLNIMSFAYKEAIDEDGCMLVRINDLENIKKILRNNGFSLNRTFRAYLSEGDFKMKSTCYEYKNGGTLIKLYSDTEGAGAVYQIFITFRTNKERDIFLKNSLQAGMGKGEAEYYYDGTAESGIIARIEGNTIQIGEEGIGYLHIIYPSPK